MTEGKKCIEGITGGREGGMEGNKKIEEKNRVSKKPEC